MLQQQWKVILTVALVVVSLFLLYPTARLATLTPEEKEQLSGEKLEELRSKSISLGLDLQGGMHLVLEVDLESLSANERSDAVDRALEIIRNRVDAFGVAEPVIQKQGRNRIIVELPGIQDEQRAKDLVGRTALLEFKLVKDEKDIQALLQQIDEALSRREETTGEKPATTTATETASQGQEEATRLFEETDTDTSALFPTELEAKQPFSHLLYKQAMGEGAFEYLIPTTQKAQVEALLADSLVQQTIAAFNQVHLPTGQFLLASQPEIRTVPGFPSGQEFYGLYLLKQRPELTGALIADATVGQPSGLGATAGSYAVHMTLSNEGRNIFKRVTGANIGERLAIVLDNKVYMAPTIRSRIPDGRAEITGRFKIEEAKDLAIVLRAGALPAKVSIVEERTIGPSLGRDSIQSGFRAGLYGLVLVGLFMVVYYLLPGGIANLALILNLIFILAVLAGFRFAGYGVALTLPGIAGIILTVGMAVDANVLIFERIREELRSQKTLRMAIESGYQRAFRTILDANVTTLITAIVLFQFGSGPVKGFAVTLSIGIVASMFTAIFVTRMIFNAMPNTWLQRIKLFAN